MHFVRGDDYNELLYKSLRLIRSRGRSCSPRGRRTRELQSVCLRIHDPTGRVSSLEGRKSNVFATLADTLWVLSGRNDIAFISYYLRRIGEYSDDGVTLHGGYGPRLRNWEGVDQVAEAVRLLRETPSTRRCVIGLFDPSRGPQSGAPRHPLQ